MQEFRRYLAHTSSYSPFCPKFRSHCNESPSGVKKTNWQHSMAHPRKSPYRRKNLVDISYTDRVIANFVPNFVAMATGGRSWENAIGSIQWPISEPPAPYRRKNLVDISYTNRLIANCVPNFIAMATRGSGVKLNDTIRLAIPENLTLEPKIMTLSYTQPKL